MKRICLFLVGTACIPISNLAAAPVASPPEIVERGPHSRRVEWTTAETLLDGRVTARKHGYTELAVGMHYKNQKDGPWLESREDIELFQGGAVFRQAQHKVVFDANAAAPQGAIDLEMPGGKRWRSTVLGIAVIDPATQRSELVAEIKSCVGELQSPNTVLYRDAFDFASGARASIRYTCTRDRFEQDVICLDQIVLPAGYGPGSKLEVWSEVFGPPEFVKSTRLAGSAQD